MTKMKTIALTAVLAFSGGILAAGPLKGHPNLEKARASLSEAQKYITKSQTANEGVWKDEGGHAKKAKELIQQAKEELDKGAEWVNTHH